MYKKVHCYYSFTSTLSSMYCYIQELVFLYEEEENSCVRLSKGSRRLGKRNCVGDNAALGRFFFVEMCTSHKGRQKHLASLRCNKCSVHRPNIAANNVFIPD